MAYSEFHIDGRYKLYARFYHTLSENQNMNPFLATHRTALDSTADSTLAARYQFWKRLENLPDLFAADTNGDKYIPLNFHLVVPRGVGTAPHPLAVFIHGQAPTYFDDDDNPAETKSYRGYRYLQQYLGNKGVASVSVNVNVASFLEDTIGGGHEHYEPQSRIEICFLVLAALKQLSDAPVTAGQPILFKKSDNSLVPLQEALALTAPFRTGSQEALLHQLKSGIAGKLSFTNLGFMGHSRGGATVQFLQPYFTARIGTAPADYTAMGASATSTFAVPSGPYNSNTRQTFPDDFQTVAHLYHAIHDAAAIFGSPTMDALKMIVSLQPSENRALIDSPTTFFLVVASSHDEDVQEDAFNSYENVNSPKAIIFSHGASHARFNSVWRQIRGIRATIMQQLICQNPIHMLSNAGHENLAKATIGNAFLAGLLGQNHRYRFFTDEIRATSIGQDLERVWKFPFPFASPPAIVLLDGRAITATNTTTSTAVTVDVEPDLNDRTVNSNHIYANKIAVKRVSRPANQSLALRIPVQSADSLATRTHFNFRYTKEYDARSAAARRAVKLRNYTLRLKSGSTIIGNPIEGRNVRTQVQVAYPTFQFGDNGVDPPTCFDDTMILMQTAEVPLSQFLGSQPVTDLNQVDTIEITLLGDSTAGSAAEVYFFVDFILVTRNLPAAPAGFEVV